MARRGHLGDEKARRIAQPEYPIHPPPHPVMPLGTEPSVSPKPAPVPQKGFETTDLEIVAYLRTQHLRHESESGVPMVYGYAPGDNDAIAQALRVKALP